MTIKLKSDPSIYGVDCPSLKEIRGASLCGFPAALTCFSHELDLVLGGLNERFRDRGRFELNFLLVHKRFMVEIAFT